MYNINHYLTDTGAINCERLQQCRHIGYSFLLEQHLANLEGDGDLTLLCQCIVTNISPGASPKRFNSP